MIPSAAAVALVQQAEGLRLDVYCCSGGKWTQGFGRTHGISQFDPPITEETARLWLAEDLARAGGEVEALLKVPATQGQFDSLVSFAYNCGSGALGRSTLLRLLNAGDAAGAANQFSRWDKARGRPLEGLTRRRAEEKRIFEGG